MRRLEFAHGEDHTSPNEPPVDPADTQPDGVPLIGTAASGDSFSSETDSSCGPPVMPLGAAPTGISFTTVRSESRDSFTTIDTESSCAAASKWLAAKASCEPKWKSLQACAE